MYTELEIKAVNSKAFIEYYFNGARQRMYSGAKLGLNLFPNRAKSMTDKIKLLTKLQYEIQRALDKGWDPLKAVEEQLQPKMLTLQQACTQRLESRLNSQISRTYKRDLKSIYDKLIDFLTTAEKNRTLEELPAARISEFLDQFNTSNSNYMTKRKTLNVLLPTATAETRSKRTTESMHGIYSKDQLLNILRFLKDEYPKLHLLALLTYGCLLRPHEEARSLQKKNIIGRSIILAGSENKGKRNRVIPIPEYVYEELCNYIVQCDDEQSYIFTGTPWLLNNYYFNTQWGRAKVKMIEQGLLQPTQTLYSFRHTAAVNVYRKTKDVHLVQKMLGHSSVVVTLKYLRGLGEIDVDDLRDAAPEL
jgi:integrase